MDLIQCSIYDEKSGVYAQPFFAPSIPHAKRTFGDFCNDRETIVGMHPGDFTLFKIGVFDVQDGKLVADFNMLGSGAEFVNAIVPLAVTA